MNKQAITYDFCYLKSMQSIDNQCDIVGCKLLFSLKIVLLGNMKIA